MMAEIGVVARREDGSFHGTLSTVSFTGKIRIVPNCMKLTEAQPDYRVFCKHVEIGAGWTRFGRESGSEYIGLKLESPDLGPHTIYANLGRSWGQSDETIYAIIWNPRGDNAAQGDRADAG